MTGAWTVEWQGYGEESRRRVVTTADEALAAYEEAGVEGPVLVRVTPEGGDAPLLTVGAGAAWAVVTYQETAEPPYVTSRGTGAPEALSFAFDGEETAVPPGCLVPGDVARAALHEFVTSGQRPGAVEWAEV